MSQSDVPVQTPTQEPPPSASQPSRFKVYRKVQKTFAFLRDVFTPLVAIAVALLIGVVILLAAKYNPIIAYQALFEGAFKDLNSFVEVLLQATPLICIAAGLAVAFHCGIWNIGGEGQFYAGAVAATVVGICLRDLPGWILMPLVLLGGIVNGALWGMLVAFLKNRFGANEVVTTVMLNYLAIIGTSYLVTGPMIEKVGSFPQTAQISKAAWLPRILPPTRLNIGFVLTLILAIALYLLIYKSSLGYSIRAVGANPEAARYAGIDVKRKVLIAMAISGGAAGLGGAIQVAGLTYRLYALISPGFGYTAVAVTLLVGNNPLGIILSGILFGALSSGSELMQANANVPSVLVSVIEGLVILSVIAFGVYRSTTLEKEE